MRVSLILVLCLFCVTPALAQTQLEMNRAAKADYVETDKALNDTYQKILQSYKGDASFIQNMKQSQRAWLKYRDLQITLKYPARPFAGGSMMPVCRLAYSRELTQNRIAELRQWLDAPPEGEMCAGTVKRR